MKVDQSQFHCLAYIKSSNKLASQINWKLLPPKGRWVSLGLVGHAIGGQNPGIAKKMDKICKTWKTAGKKVLQYGMKIALLCTLCFLVFDPDGKMHIFEEIYSALLADCKKNPIGHWMSRMKRRDLIHLLGHQNIFFIYWDTQISFEISSWPPKYLLILKIVLINIVDFSVVLSFIFQVRKK